MTDNLSIITIKQPFITDFGKVRNQALKNAQTSWVLFIDSDETISNNLEKEIKKAVKNKSFNYQFKRQDWFLGKRLNFGETSKAKLTRLVQKGTGQWQGKVHEVFQSTLPIKILKYPIIHQRHLSINQFLDKLNHYSSIRAKELKHFSLFQLIFYPPLKFLQNYIFRLGFLDGLPGLAMAFMMSLHSLMVRIKTYELKQSR